MATCVCGCQLQRVLGVVRYRSTFADADIPMVGEYAAENYLRRIVGSQLEVVKCDLCGASVKANQVVWTCKNGNATILHATSYDVCEKCLLKHTLTLDDEEYDNDKYGPLLTRTPRNEESRGYF